MLDANLILVPNDGRQLPAFQDFNFGLHYYLHR
jgi:hypothetical protein